MNMMPIKKMLLFIFLSFGLVGDGLHARKPRKCVKELALVCHEDCENRMRMGKSASVTEPDSQTGVSKISQNASLVTKPGQDVKPEVCLVPTPCVPDEQVQIVPIVPESPVAVVPVDGVFQGQINEVKAELKKDFLPVIDATVTQTATVDLQASSKVQKDEVKNKNKVKRSKVKKNKERKEGTLLRGDGADHQSQVVQEVLPSAGITISAEIKKEGNDALVIPNQTQANSDTQQSQIAVVSTIPEVPTQSQPPLESNSCVSSTTPANQPVEAESTIKTLGKKRNLSKFEEEVRRILKMLLEKDLTVAQLEQMLIHLEEDRALLATMTYDRKFKEVFATRQEAFYRYVKYFENKYGVKIKRPKNYKKLLRGLVVVSFITMVGALVAYDSNQNTITTPSWNLFKQNLASCAKPFKDLGIGFWTWLNDPQ